MTTTENSDVDHSLVWSGGSDTIGAHTNSGVSCVYSSAAVGRHRGISNSDDTPKHLRVGDFVTVGLSAANFSRLLPCGVPPVGQVTAVWTSHPSGSVRCELRLMFRPGLQNAPPRRPYHGAAEVIASADSFLECPVEDVSGVGECTVEWAEDYMQRSHFPELAFFCRERQLSGGGDTSTVQLCRDGGNGEKLSLAEAVLAVSVSPRSRMIAESASAAVVSSSADPATACIKDSLQEDDFAHEGEAQKPERLEQHEQKQEAPAPITAQAIPLPDIHAMDEAEHEQHKKAPPSEEQQQPKPSPLKRLTRLKDVTPKKEPPQQSPLAAAVETKTELPPPKQEQQQQQQQQPGAPFSVKAETKSPSARLAECKPKSTGTIMSWIERASSGSSKGSRIARMPRLELHPASGSSQRHDNAAEMMKSVAASIPVQTRIKAFLKPIKDEFPADEEDEAAAKRPRYHDEERERETKRRERTPTPPSVLTDVFDTEETSQSERRSHGMDSFIVSDNDEEALAQYEPKPRQKQIQHGGEGEGEEERPHAQPQQQQTRSGVMPVYTLRHAFEVYIQFLASACLDPDFLAAAKDEDDYFMPARKRVERELLAKKECLVTSTVWTPEFQADLQCRPVFKSYFEKSLTEHNSNCDACRRTRHAAVFSVTLSGTPYDTDNVWSGDMSAVIESPVDGDAGVGTGNADDGEGASVASASTPATTAGEEHGMQAEVVYHLGKFCHKRANLFHKLEHYKYALIASIKRKLESLAKRLGDGAQSKDILTELLDDSDWVSEKYDFYKTLLTEADDFMDEKHE